jgi:hypothetical protein
MSRYYKLLLLHENERLIKRNIGEGDLLPLFIYVGRYALYTLIRLLLPYLQSAPLSASFGSGGCIICLHEMRRAAPDQSSAQGIRRPSELRYDVTQKLRWKGKNYGCRCVSLPRLLGLLRSTKFIHNYTTNSTGAQHRDFE